MISRICFNLWFDFDNSYLVKTIFYPFSIAMVRNKQQVLDLIQTQKAAIQQLGAERLGLFGSFARGEQRETSDIDLVVEFKSGMKTYRNLLNLADLLEELLQKKVDLLTWEGMASFVQREAKKDIEYVTFTD
ncbi:MAG: nucleotidyltransferase family protein [Dyadobacter sp.]|uniref:nucleotidyltransferase family protein n=1 Tax=Dyadobacter sp. TaxID=1914288 RepID=UPI0032677D5B